MGFKDSVLDVMTLGAHGKLKTEQEKFERLCEHYRNKHQESVDLNKQIKRHIERLGEITIDSFKLLEQASILLKSSYYHNQQFSQSSQQHVQNTLPHIHVDQLLNQYQGMFADSLKGSAAGSGLMVGAWTLVTTFGTASTGAAIGGLSGAAATNAGLAWFGGGAIAAGGGGMALGSVVLGGIAVLPALGYVGYKARKSALDNIKKIEEESKKVESEIEKLQPILQSLNDKKALTTASLNRINLHYTVFKSQVNKTVNLIAPYTFWKRLYRLCRTWLGWSYYTEREQQSLAELKKATDEFAEYYGNLHQK